MPYIQVAREMRIPLMTVHEPWQPSRELVFFSFAKSFVFFGL